MFDLLAVGELNVDVILAGLKNPPKMGNEVLAESYTECLGSSTAICACAAASLGVKTAFWGKVGADAHGRLVLDTLKKYGIDTSPIIVKPEYRTGVTVSLSMPSDRAMVTYFGDSINSFTAEEVPIGEIPARHIHIGSFFLQTRLQEKLSELFRRAHALGMTTSLDAGWDDYGRWMDALGDVLSETDFFFPNETEAAAITGTEDLEKAARIIAAKGCNAVVKNGAKGSLMCTKDGRLLRQAGFKAPRVVDTTGAGDSFNAGFLKAYLEGQTFEMCLRWGNASGAVSVGYQGGTTHCPTVAEAESLLRDN